MLETLDGLVLRHVAQPMVDALQLDPARWPRKAAQAASSAFVVSCLGVAAIFALAAMPFDSATTIVLGAAHVLSVRIDAYAGRLRQASALGPFSRLFLIAETIGCTLLLGYVHHAGSAVWTALVAVFVAGLCMAAAVAYVSICDRPPPPRRRDTTRAVGAGA
jgi:hypothetical protein